MSLLRSGENRICPNCAKGYYVKPCIASNPKRGKYCSNKCQHEYRVKLGLPLPGTFQSKPKYCATCNTELKNKNKKYCSDECKPTPKRRASNFTLKREELKKKGIAEFAWNEQCGVCKKTDQIYYTCVTSKVCKKCNNERAYKARKQNKTLIKKQKEYARQYRKNNKEKIKKYQKNYAKNNKEKIKSIRRKTEKNPKNKAIRNVRKRLKIFLKSLNVNNKNYSKSVGCTKRHFIEHIESKFTSKMSWDNYGTYWHIDHIIPISSFDLTDPDQCKQANHWTNLQPLEAKQNIAKSNKIVAPQMNLMLNV